MMEWVWMIVGVVLTLMVFSYIFGDNFLFRVATYLFVGVAAGYVFVVVFYQVLMPRLIEPIFLGTMAERVLAVVPLLGAALLLFKVSPRLAFLGKAPMAFLVGVGAAVAIGGSVFGTLLGQVSAAGAPFRSASGILEGLLALIGAVGVLAYFQFSAPARASLSGEVPKRPAWMEALAWVGQVFLGITLGALFSGVLIASLTALLDRVQAILLLLARLLS